MAPSTILRIENPRRKQKRQWKQQENEYEAHEHNSRTQETENGGLLFGGQSGIYNKTLSQKPKTKKVYINIDMPKKHAGEKKSLGK